jgi:hypothetical protein
MEGENGWGFRFAGLNIATVTRSCCKANSGAQVCNGALPSWNRHLSHGTCYATAASSPARQDQAQGGPAPNPHQALGAAWRAHHCKSQVGTTERERCELCSDTEGLRFLHAQPGWHRSFLGPGHKPRTHASIISSRGWRLPSSMTSPLVPTNPKLRCPLRCVPPLVAHPCT